MYKENYKIAAWENKKVWYYNERFIPILFDVVIILFCVTTVAARPIKLHIKS